MFEAQPLSKYPASPERNAALPLGPPREPAITQGLELATNADVLIGRADNGVTLSLSSETWGAPHCCLYERHVLLTHTTLVPHFWR